MGVEKINLSNILISDVIDSKFKADLKKLALDFEFISLILVSQKNKSLPLIMSHENEKELEAKKIHISCGDEKILNQFSKLLEDKYGAKND